MNVHHIAMHLSDGIVNAPTSLLLGVTAIGALGFCVTRARSELDERAVPLAGLVAAFIFAVQMVNFPILPGVSGHLLGGALAAILVGPFAGALCIALVLTVQALLFADGGVTALGPNIINMAVFGVAAGYGSAVLLYALVRRRAHVSVTAVAVVAFLAALVATVCAATGFVLEFAIGGAAPASLAAVLAYMGGMHVLIGVGEGAITALTVVAVVRVRPDLVYLMRKPRAQVPV
ncbi:cobalamin biosynthesis protein CbiM [Mycolicibacterium doricum]|uniref:Cobalamin biosynthesis protein CbiM n=1 Tax=Mycolicibacterium doricum TaxID=126673 RepID=A0A1X1T848_9MYCO|nr:energy-coupling factor ABC transporter permease [Mycolicibacterium doricum]MCV7268950.1 energy-coupling factor ABC transporter permease [Mycolicibacterium doricum]ORV40688.1 cobalamin biosynthesis protein CbiM [Mycolicibacterium doricum]BBZ07258.1 cobalamin biosynthesis protein CbiM [Mycolicibacterium doricum]